jgi:hypothetical protein
MAQGYMHPIPHPDEIIPPKAGKPIKGFYVVICGRECGVYFSWYVD